MQRNIVETILGAVVLLVAGAFMFFFYRTTDIKPVNGYELSASFDKADGLETGSPVRIAGVKVGQVLGFELDKKTYRAIVHLNIAAGIDLPADTSAVISSAGLLDGKFITLQPGSDEELLQPGGKIEYGQSTPSLEQMLGQFIFAVTKKDSKDSSSEDAPKEEAPASQKSEAPAPAPENAASGKDGAPDHP